MNLRIVSIRSAFAREETTLAHLDIVRVLRGVVLAHETLLTKVERVELVDQVGNFLLVLFGRSDRETLGLYVRIQFPVVRMNLFGKRDEGSRHNPASRKSVEHVQFLPNVAHGRDDRSEQLAFIAEIGEHRLVEIVHYVSSNPSRYLCRQHRSPSLTQAPHGLPFLHGAPQLSLNSSPSNIL